MSGCDLGGGEANDCGGNGGVEDGAGGGKGDIGKEEVVGVVWMTASAGTSASCVPHVDRDASTVPESALGETEVSGSGAE